MIPALNLLLRYNSYNKIHHLKVKHNSVVLNVFIVLYNHLHYLISEYLHYRISALKIFMENPFTLTQVKRGTLTKMKCRNSN